MERQIILLQVIYLAIGSIAVAYTLNKKKSGQAGLTPNHSTTSVGLAAVYCALMLAYDMGVLDKTLYSLTMGVMLLLIIARGLIVHVANYLSYKTELRQAKKRKARTGERTMVYLRGYSSLGALGLMVCINIVGVIATGAAVGIPYYQ